MFHAEPFFFTGDGRMQALGRWDWQLFLVLSPYPFNSRAASCLLCLVHSRNSRRFTLRHAVRSNTLKRLSNVKLIRWHVNASAWDTRAHRKACVNKCRFPSVDHWREAQPRSVNLAQAQS